ncbi:integrase, partial [bacterium]|nr:integrase [bacterium]
DHTLPIASPLLSYFKELKKKTGHTLWLFPNPDHTGPLSESSRKAMRIVIKKSIHFTPHDLRRTFATIAEAVYLPQTIIKRLLNHVTDNDVTGGYIRTEMNTLREAINKIASYINAKVSANSNVIPLINHI